MSFAVRHRRRARTELDACAAQLNPEFRASVQAWLQELASEAELGEQTKSADAKDFLEQLGAQGEQMVPPTGLDRWLALGCRDKVQAFLAWLRAWIASWTSDKQPLWEFRMAMEVFLVPYTVAGTARESPGVVLALYEVDRAKRQIIVTKYVELPCRPPAT